MQRRAKIKKVKKRSEEIVQGLQEKNERMQEKKERFDMYQEEQDIRTKRMIDDIILQFQQEKIKMQRTQFEQHGNIEGVFNSENLNHTNLSDMSFNLDDSWLLICRNTPINSP